MTDIDTPDLAHALANDSDGSFRSAVTTYLKGWQTRIVEAKKSGMTPEEFEALTQLDTGIATAGRLLELFARLKVTAPGGSESTKN